MRFLLDFNGWEVESVEFLQLTESNPPSSVNGDCVRWILKKNGDFDFCSYYIMLEVPLLLSSLGKAFGS